MSGGSLTACFAKRPVTGPNECHPVDLESSGHPVDAEAPASMLLDVLTRHKTHVPVDFTMLIRYQTEADLHALNYSLTEREGISTLRKDTSREGN